MADFNHWNAIADRLEKATSRVVRKTALDIQANAIAGAPIDTGFLRASIYTVTSTKSTYGQGRAGDQGGTLNVYKAMHQDLLPSVETPSDNQTAYVAVGASYGLYLEYGTMHMPAHPYFYAAVEAAQGPFDDALGKIEAQLGSDVGGSIDDETIL